MGTGNKFGRALACNSCNHSCMYTLNTRQFRFLHAIFDGLFRFIDEDDAPRIVNVPTRGISDTSVKQMKAFAIASGISLWQAMERADLLANRQLRQPQAGRLSLSGSRHRSWSHAGRNARGDLAPHSSAVVAALVGDHARHRRSGLVVCRVRALSQRAHAGVGRGFVAIAGAHWRVER